MTDDLVDVPLTSAERRLLRSGLREWGGSARGTDAVALAMGFDDLADLDRRARELGARLDGHLPLSRADWRRVLVATEIVFASDVFGAGVDWPTTTGWTDEESIHVLRGLQRKIAAMG